MYDIIPEPAVKENKYKMLSLLLAFFLESTHPPTITFLMHFLVNCSHARMHLKRHIWSL